MPCVSGVLASFALWAGSSLSLSLFQLLGRTVSFLSLTSLPRAGCPWYYVGCPWHYVGCPWHYVGCPWYYVDYPWYQCSLEFCKVCVRIKIFFGIFYLNSSGFGMMCIRYVPKNIFGRNINVRSKFSCVRSSCDLCARAHAHSLEGTLLDSMLATSLVQSDTLNYNHNITSQLFLKHKMTSVLICFNFPWLTSFCLRWGSRSKTQIFQTIHPWLLSKTPGSTIQRTPQG